MEQAIYENWLDKQLIPGLPAECFQMEDSRPGVFAASHWHSAAELIFVTQGGYRVLVNGSSYVLKEGEAILIPPRQIHTTICPPLPQVSLLVLKFDLSLLHFTGETEEETLFLEPLETGYQGLCFTKEQTEISGCQEKLRRILQALEGNQPGRAYQVRLLIAQIVLELLRLSKPVRPGSESEEGRIARQFYPVFDYLEKNFAEPITPADLLPICGLSYSRFAVRFKQLAGCSFTEYLNRYRILQAQQLLRESEIPVAQAAEQCGFLDPCYFDRLFRKYVGVSPTKWLLSCRKKTPENRCSTP